MKKTNVTHKNSELTSILNTHFKGKLNLARVKLISYFMNVDWFATLGYGCGLQRVEPSSTGLVCGVYKLQTKPVVLGSTSRKPNP